MESKELNLNKDYGGGNNSRGGDGFIDRSKVRILLCDNDDKSLEEVLTLLLKCSYQGEYCFVYSFIFAYFCRTI
jgi:pseudo-response regulator 1